MDIKLRYRIEQYLDNALSEEARASFELDLQRDTKLSDAFESYLREMNLLVDVNGVSDVKKTGEVPFENAEPTIAVYDEENAKLDLDLEEKNQFDFDGSSNEPSPTKDSLLKRLNPIVIFLIGFSLFFLTRWACTDTKSPASFLPESGEASPEIAKDIGNDNIDFEGITAPDEADAASPELTKKGRNSPLDSNSIGNAPPPPPPSKSEKKGCKTLLSEAQEYIESDKLELAQMPLLEIIRTENSACQGDAWFHMARLRLKLGDPNLALDCLAKVDNIDKYGQDIQWYMALCFYEKSKDEPDMRERAQRAIERAISASESADRKEKGKALIEQLK